MLRNSALLPCVSLVAVVLLAPTLTACGWSPTTSSPSAAGVSDPHSAPTGKTAPARPITPAGISVFARVTNGSVSPAAKTYQVARGTPISVTVTRPMRCTHTAAPKQRKSPPAVL